MPSACRQLVSDSVREQCDLGLNLIVDSFESLWCGLFLAIFIHEAFWRRPVTRFMTRAGRRLALSISLYLSLLSLSTVRREDGLQLLCLINFEHYEQKLGRPQFDPIHKVNLFKTVVALLDRS